MHLTFPASASTLVLIDPAIEQYHQLVSGVLPNTEVIVLDPNQDGIEQITQMVSDRRQLASLHIVSHGRSGELQLGATRFSSETIARYAQHLRSWATSFQKQAEILLYACEVAVDGAGQSFVQQISRLTGMAVSASTTLTGSTALGGNWELNFRTDSISQRRSPLAFQPQVLQTYPAVLATLVDENFRGADVTNKPWIFGTGTGSANPFLTARTGTAPSANGLPGAAVALDTPTNGALRLTNATNDQATFVIYNAPIAANGGVSITFDFFAYNGTAFGLPASNGDGISFFLINGTASPTTAGAFGGSLGYAQKQVQGIAGITGGYLGIGLDEFGNFSTSLEGALQQRPTPTGAATPVQDSVAVRGSEASQYAFLTGTGTLTPGIDTPVAPTRDAALRRAKIDLTPTGILNVQVDLNGDNDFADAGEQAVTNFNVATVNGALPSTFKFGFASSTGSATNIHEVRNLVINTFTDPPVAADATVTVATGGSTNLTGLSATDPDGTIASYTLSTLPAATQGTLFLGNPSSGGTAVTAGQVLTPAQITQLFFQPANGFTGASFAYTATDNQGAIDSTPATVTLSRSSTGTNRPPTLPSPTVGSIDPGETLNLTGLAGRDIDGTITSYVITSLPPANQGTLFLGRPSQGGKSVTVGQVLTPAQINQLFFRAGSGFTGASFSYGATDNAGDRTNSTITLAASATAGGGTSSCKPGRTLKGNSGSNVTTGTKNADKLIGFAGNDSLNGKGCDDKILGGRGNDRLFGEAGSDLLQGGSGSDRLNGGKGEDRLSGGLGKDLLNGANRNDQLTGDRGDDVLKGGNGRDRLDGGLGNDKLQGGNGDDLLNGRQNNDVLNGEKGNDVLNGGIGRDRLNGGRGQDTLDGGISNDSCFGGGGADVIRGGKGRDRLVGGTQNDRLIGGAQGDYIVGGGGADTLSGNTGRDRFVYRSSQKGIDTITDFQIARRGTGAIDKIDLSRIFAKPGYSRGDHFKKYVRLSSSAEGAIVRVDFNGNAAGGFQNLITLTGVVPSVLSARNFLL
ncbi:MAG TPA: DUF4347 domain-containing protein [Coleofasciculaceae cyanobacterium]